LALGGRTYRLAYSFNAIAEAEHLAGCNLLGGLENLENLTAIQLRGLLYAALVVAHPTIPDGDGQRPLTVEDAGLLVRLDTIGPITGALAEAYRLSMPEKKQDPPKAGAPAGN